MPRDFFVEIFLGSYLKTDPPLDGKQSYNDSDLRDFFINQSFPHFSSTCCALKKVR